MGQRQTNGAGTDYIDEYQPKYGDFLVEPASSMSIKQYIPLILRSITHKIRDVLIPDVIIKLILSYYPFSSTYKIYQITTNSVKTINELSKYCGKHPSNIYFGLQKYFVINENDDLYGIGLNYHGSLGIGSMSHTLKKCNKIMISDQNKDINIDIVSNGICANHTFVVDKTGEIYGWGSNRYMQLGLFEDDQQLFCYRPLKRESLNEFFIKTIKRKIIKIECGRDFTIFLCDNRRVYSLGNNDSGQCGHEQSQRIISTPPKLITQLKNIKDVCCGSTFVTCLNNKGKIYCFGDNSAGYLGLSHNDVIFVPLVHPFFKSMNIKHIRCGSRHCMFILFNGDCYLCGSDSNGQCNFLRTDELKDVLYPDPQLYTKKVKNGWCGDSHTVIYSIDNELIAFGAVRFQWNRNVHNNFDIKDNEYIVRILPTHNATFLVVLDNNNDIKN